MRWLALVLTLLLASLPGARAVDAQPAGHVPRVGFAYFGSGQTGLGAERYAAFLEGMRALGYVEGKNVVVEARFAEAKVERVPTLVQEMLHRKVDVIVATGIPFYRALQRLTIPVPIVVTVTPDPVLSGLAETVARPGGNFTGLSDTAADLTLKQLELLRTVVPKLSKIGVLLSPDNRTHAVQATRLILAGQKLGVPVLLAEAGAVPDIDPAIASLARERVHAVILLGDTFFSQQLQEIARSALKHRLPSIYMIPDYVEAGGLMSYGAPLIENFRRAATYVDKILKGAKPAELPFEQPTSYRLAINVKTARALGLTVPPPVLLQANRVVE